MLIKGTQLDDQIGRTGIRSRKHKLLVDLSVLRRSKVAVAHLKIPCSSL